VTVGIQFGVLGPLEVLRDGEAVTIAGRRQRALLALLLCHPNRFVSRDQLINELFGETAGRSPERMLRVQLSRLRKALAEAGADRRVVAEGSGYVLKVGAGELDLDVFERLVADGRAALAAGEPGRAAALLRQAQDIWRGRALADLEDEPFAQLEGRRLEELRLLAREDRIEADLALGHHAPLCAELTALTAEHPLRERLRGQLMLALYRAGRQAEALAVYRQTGDLLREELGLEPGVALRTLELSILQQDAMLETDGGNDGNGNGNGASVVCPFKGLESFDIKDAGYFFGRERLAAELAGRLTESSLVGIVGASGIGKSSLLKAGLLAELSSGALPASARWPQVIVRPGRAPTAALASALGEEPLAALASLRPGERMVVAVDQLEELFTTCDDEDERAAFLQTLWGFAQDIERRAIVIVAVRGDFYARLTCHPQFAELLSANHVLVGPMDRDQLARAVERPATRAGLAVEPALVDALAAEAAGRSGALPLLSATLFELWRSRDGRALRLDSYRTGGGMAGAVARIAEQAYAGMNGREKAIAKEVMVRLAAERDGMLTRRAVPVAELARSTGAETVAATLIDARLLTLDAGSVELAHEALLMRWPRYRRWLDEDREARRLQSHLAAAASEWEERGRDPGELYREARLAGAVEWASQHAERLSPLEREFLDASRRAGQREQHRRQAQHRRLRALLTASILLLVLTAAAAVVAELKQTAARHDARESFARQLGADAVTEPRLDMAMLMAREALRLAPSAQTAASLLATLQRSPTVVATLSLKGVTGAALAARPDGRSLAVAENDGHLQVFASGAGIKDPVALSAVSDQPAPVYSPDGTLLAAGATPGVWDFPRGNNLALITVRDARSLQVDAQLSLPGVSAPPESRIAGGSVAISPDDHRVYYGYWVTSAHGSGGAFIQSWRLASGRPLDTARFGDGPLLAMRLIAGGSRLLAVGQDSYSVFDARSLRRLSTVPIRTPGPSSAAAVTPDGRFVAIGSRSGSMSFLDRTTGRLTVRAALPGASVVATESSTDGQVVAVTADDHVMVWNPSTGVIDDDLTGPAGDVISATLTQDGHTLYTTLTDGLLLRWDLSGTHWFGSRVRLAAPSACCGPPAPPGPPLALSPDGRRFAALVRPSVIGLFSALTGARLASFTAARDGTPVTALAWSPSGDELAIAGQSGLAQLWSMRGAPRLLHSLSGLGSDLGYPDAAQAIRFSADGRLVAATSVAQIGPGGDGATGEQVTLGLWHAASGVPLDSLDDLNSTLNNGTAHGAKPSGEALVAFSDSGLLAVSTPDGVIQVFEPMTAQVRRIVDTGAGTSALTFAPDGTLAAGTPTGMVQRWDVLSGRQITAPIVASADPVTAIAFDGSGARFATSGQGAGAVKLWLSATRESDGQALATDTASTAAVAFSRAGSSLIALDTTGNAFTWPTTLRSWTRRACDVAGGDPTAHDWTQFVGRGISTAVCP
jgi:DNA-binding SARP family transcriptional activator/WD40 repeat protein